MNVAPYTDAEIAALRAGEHAELLPNCPTCKWLVTIDAIRAQHAHHRELRTRAWNVVHRASEAFGNGLCTAPMGVVLAIEHLEQILRGEQP